MAKRTDFHSSVIDDTAQPAPLPVGEGLGVGDWTVVGCFEVGAPPPGLPLEGEEQESLALKGVGQGGLAVERLGA